MEGASFKCLRNQVTSCTSKHCRSRGTSQFLLPLLARPREDIAEKSWNHCWFAPRLLSNPQLPLEYQLLPFSATSIQRSSPKQLYLQLIQLDISWHLHHITLREGTKKKKPPSRHFWVKNIIPVGYGFVPRKYLMSSSPFFQPLFLDSRRNRSWASRCRLLRHLVRSRSLQSCLGPCGVGPRKHRGSRLGPLPQVPGGDTSLPSSFSTCRTYLLKKNKRGGHRDTETQNPSKRALNFHWLKVAASARRPSWSASRSVTSIKTSAGISDIWWLMMVWWWFWWCFLLALSTIWQKSTKESSLILSNVDRRASRSSESLRRDSALHFWKRASNQVSGKRSAFAENPSGLGPETHRLWRWLYQYNSHSITYYDDKL